MPADRSTLVLSAAVREAIDRHAREGVPHEICGVLTGTRNAESDGADTSDATDAMDATDATDDPDRVTGHRPVDNVADSPRTRYELAPEATLATIEDVEAAGDDVVGFYHSHPVGPLEPSATDERRATWPGYVYAIVVPGEGVGAWRWTGERFVVLDLEVEAAD